MSRRKSGCTNWRAPGPGEAREPPVGAARRRGSLADGVEAGEPQEAAGGWMNNAVPQVLAAGGVVWRLGAHDALEVLLVHRPAYDDWSFPKGKLSGRDPDEESCALREVREETGYQCALGRELSTARYFDQKNRSKRVRYWEMRILQGEFRPNAEVDEVAWLSVPDARERLSYDHDIGVLDEFARFAGQS
jgi:8-oxo-dGTP diphosphatase